MYDWPYNKYTKLQFKKDLEKTHSILENYSNNISKWYRAPHAKFSKNMEIVLEQNGLTHVVCDAFASDTSIPDPKWIANYILNRVKPGSIVLIHMPEKGVREWNFEAMRLTLEGLTEKGLNILTLSELSKIKE